MSNIPIGISNFSINRDLAGDPDLPQKSPPENLSQLEDSIWYHLSNMLQNENINNIIESSQILQTKVTEALIRVNDMYNSSSATQTSPAMAADREEESRIMNAMAAVVTDQCISLKHKLNQFFSLLKTELRTTEGEESSEGEAVSNLSQAERVESESSRSSFASINYPLPDNINGGSKEAGNYLNVNRSSSNELSGRSVCATSCQNLSNVSSNSMPNQMACRSSINLSSGRVLLWKRLL